MIMDIFIPRDVGDCWLNVFIIGFIMRCRQRCLLWIRIPSGSDKTKLTRNPKEILNLEDERNYYCSLAATRIESNGIAQCCHFHLIWRGEGLLYLSILCCADFHFIDLTLNVLEKCWTIMGAGNHCATIRDYFNSVWWAMVSAVEWCRVQRHMSSEIKFIAMKQFPVCLASFSFLISRLQLCSEKYHFMYCKNQISIKIGYTKRDEFFVSALVMAQDSRRSSSRCILKYL